MLKFKYHLREKYDNSYSKAANEYFNISKKIERLKSDIDFITTCLNNEKMPNFGSLNLAKILNSVILVQYVIILT